MKQILENQKPRNSLLNILLYYYGFIFQTVKTTIWVTRNVNKIKKNIKTIIESPNKKWHLNWSARHNKNIGSWLACFDTQNDNKKPGQNEIHLYQMERN